jgi:hypothetical protein
MTRKQAKRNVLVEALEERRMFVTYQVTGTSGADSISISISGNSIISVVNGVSDSASDFLNNNIQIDALGGADTITIVETGDNTVEVNGGDANDTINIGLATHTLDSVDDLITINGDAGTDTTSFFDENHTGSTVYDFTSGNRLARSGMSQVIFGTENITLGTGSGADTFNVKGALSATLTIDGNAGTDFLEFISTTNETASVTPSATTTGSGTATFGARSITFTDMLRVIGGELGSLTVTTPNAVDTLAISNGVGATSRVTGTSGATTLTEVAFEGVNTVLLDMGANDAGGGSDALALIDGTAGMNLLRVINGTGNNVMTVGTGNYDLDVDVGATLANSTDITVDGGAVTFATQQNIKSLTLKNNAAIDFTGSGSMLVLQNLAVPVLAGSISFAAGQSGNLTGSCAIGANCTLFKGGAGAFAIGGTQSHGAGATLSVTDGTCNVTADLGSAAARPVNVIADGSIVSFFTSQHLNSVFPFGGGSILLQPNGNRVLVVNAVLTDVDLGAGKIDLNNNDMIVDYVNASEATGIRSLLHNGRANGAWNGNGIMSATARDANPKNTTLGSMEATEFKSVYGAAAKFDNETIDNTAVLIKFTYYGDADFNGVVNFDDYSRIDAGFNGHRSGWLNGDFDDIGSVNFDDYSLIDLAFNPQGAPLRPATGRGAPKLPSLN